ncbi:glycosyltransferase family 1 protein [Roseomonas hellenica]|uniref:Glycosyltransferase family 1 protein n=1 Tax=Plastoroseomonas hellenica TaxID=2687306 RepID=A0ABS5EUF7_9PROT|nr:glycosyltransferase [Plastoroseomonas hellenica]MBR0663909.1 glycosyltransferase family 1 protein [Plastoroseomonas hellenica]
MSRSPARILGAVFQGGGNLELILPVLAELAARGHSLRVMVGPGIRRSRLPASPGLHRRLAQAGAEVVALSEPAAHPLDSAPSARALFGGWAPGAFRGASAEARTWLWAPAWAEGVAMELRRAPADLVVADFMLPGALAAAEAAGVPGVALAHTVPIRPAPGVPPYGPGWLPPAGALGALRDLLGQAALERIWRRDGLPALNMARTALRLPPLRGAFDQLDRVARVLVLAGAAFDFPARRGADAPANLRHVGTPLGDDIAGAAPAWTPPWPLSDDRRLVLISLSTLAQGQEGLMRRCLSAVGMLEGVQALVTLGPALDLARFRAPPNARLERFVPHAAVLPKASAAVTQCGLGTVAKALAHGVPLVCLPLLGDQPENAARVVARGAGLRLSGDVPPGRIAEALRRVLVEPEFRAGAARLGASLSEEGHPATRAADEIDAVLSSL